jgi:hypothetical protein
VGDIWMMNCADLDEDGKSELLVYLTSEEFHRVNGDGSERPVGDINKCMLESNNQRSGNGAMAALTAWGPDGVKSKEALMWSEGCFRVLADGTAAKIDGLVSNDVNGAGRVPNLIPNDPEALVTIACGNSVTLWSARRDGKGNHLKLGSRLMKVGAPPHGFSWIHPVNLAGFKGILAANQSGLNWLPIEAFQANSKVEGWGYDTGGVPVVAALAEDIDGDGVPEIFLARVDGFINVLKLADRSQIGLLNVGHPILGMAMLKGKDGKPRLAVGTKFGVHLFAPSGVRRDGSDLKLIGSQAMPVAAFAGPGGKGRDRAYVVDSAGNVTVLVIRS